MTHQKVCGRDRCCSVSCLRIVSAYSVIYFVDIVVMRWFQGGIAEAVATSKARNAIFVVFVEG